MAASRGYVLPELQELVGQDVLDRVRADRSWVHEHALAQSIGTKGFADASARWRPSLRPSPRRPEEAPQRTGGWRQAVVDRALGAKLQRLALTAHTVSPAASTASWGEHVGSIGAASNQPSTNSPQAKLSQAPPPLVGDGPEVGAASGEIGCDIGDVEECGEIPGIVDGRGVHITAAPSENGIEFMNELEEWNDCERELLGAAWGLLQAEMDLVLWALCMATGNSDAGDCLTRRLTGERGSIKLLKAHDCSPGLIEGIFSPGDWGARSGLGSRITFCARPGGKLNIATRAFCDGQRVDRECATIAIAALLLHEVTHKCLRSAFENPGRCAVTYLLQNFFTIGAFEKYPQAASSACCSADLAQISWGDSSSHFLASACAPREDGILPASGPSVAMGGPGLAPLEEDDAFARIDVAITEALSERALGGLGIVGLDEDQKVRSDQSWMP